MHCHHAETQPQERHPPTKASEFYPTPQPVADAVTRWVFDRIRLPAGAECSIVEAHAGAGAFTRPVYSLARYQHIVAIEPFIPPPQHQEKSGFADEWHRCTLEQRCKRQSDQSDRHAIFIGNPPFSLAAAHLKLALSLPFASVHVAWIVRQSFLHGPRIDDEAFPMPREVCPIRPRPSFSGNGKTDGAEYVAALWSTLDDAPPRAIRWK
jgi:hypothetical protein